MNHLVIIDGHAIAHRAYHSIPPLTFQGQPVNAIYGFYSMILSALEILKPTHLAVCLDSPGPTFRNTEFIGYRAKRSVPDHELITQLPLLPQTLDTATVPHFEMGGFEADDLIATLTRRSLSRQRRSNKKKLIDKITIITGDKDLMQLVNDRVSLFVPVQGLSKTVTYDPSGVFNKLGVRPDQVVDLKALMGDASDNYPGVTGIGPKTASELLSTYGHLDTIYDHLTEISPTISTKLIKDRDNAYLSHKLATLINNIPLEFSLKNLRFTPLRVAGMQQLFTNYNFRSLNSRLTKQFKSVSKPKTYPSKSDPNQTSLF